VKAVATAPIKNFSSRLILSQSVTFITDGAGNIIGANVTVSGTATHLGMFTAVGTVQFTPDPNNPGRILSSGTATFTASNGDKLQIAVNGALDLATGVDMGVFRFVGGTGRFGGAGSAGDFVVELILVPYAVMGFFLLLFRNASNKTLAVGAIIGLLFPYLARGAWNLTGVPFPRRPEMEGASYLAENYAWIRYWYSTAIISWPASLPMFLFGLYVGRRRLFEKTAAQRRSLWRALALTILATALMSLPVSQAQTFTIPDRGAGGGGHALQREWRATKRCWNSMPDQITVIVSGQCNNFCVIQNVALYKLQRHAGRNL
jgi:hypothetical protein